MTTAATTTDTLVRTLADHVELADLVARHTLWIDESRWDETGRIFTEDVAVRSPRGEARGFDELLALVNKGHDRFARTVHNKSNVVIDLDGDTAKVRAHDLGVFVIDDATIAAAAGIHHYTARRTADGWRFDGLEIEPVALTAPIDRAAI
ncbi:nuclear transport factor 2 family protein [Glycomyces dulcitolivorans]|uniref:nuclear transport factor 2 family protein n=1 Tax=Glycomyces dulcitolivorans TaxID=2200759 RepID=UPI000DD31449|nr:nuclear transport factor 2 family protein [Glycomyces dulcitolivorans]